MSQKNSFISGRRNFCKCKIVSRRGDPTYSHPSTTHQKANTSPQKQSVLFHKIDQLNIRLSKDRDESFFRIYQVYFFQRILILINFMPIIDSATALQQHFLFGSFPAAVLFRRQHQPHKTAKIRQERTTHHRLHKHGRRSVKP